MPLLRKLKEIQKMYNAVVLNFALLSPLSSSSYYGMMQLIIDWGDKQNVHQTNTNMDNAMCMHEYQKRVEGFQKTLASHSRRACQSSQKVDCRSRAPATKSKLVLIELARRLVTTRQLASHPPAPALLQRVRYLRQEEQKCTGMFLASSLPEYR